MILPTGAIRWVIPGNSTSAPTVESKKWPIAREDPPSMSSLRPGLTTRKRDRCSSHWSTAERTTARRRTFSPRMWPSSWWGQTFGWTRNKRRVSNETRSDLRRPQFPAAAGLRVRSGVAHRGVLGARARQPGDRGLCLRRDPGSAPHDSSLELGLSLSVRLHVVATDAVEATALLYRSSRPAVRRDRSCLLDGVNGQVCGNSTAGRVRQQHRVAAFLRVRAGRLFA